MKNKEKHIMTEEQIKTQQSSIILAFVKCTKTIPILLFCKPSTDYPNKETKTTQVTAIKTDVHQWQIYLTDASSPFFVTTKGLLNQNKNKSSPLINIVSSATRVKN
mmetsp:Transcript_48073/g.56167  ORF Transcript_48073/g.56167 Transcript_48073/m.56167 type:complete len:106 (+) Transcript_48073:849-1166(+)